MTLEEAAAKLLEIQLNGYWYRTELNWSVEEVAQGAYR